MKKPPKSTVYELWVHDMIARSLDQVRGYLNGDAHALSKVQLFDGSRFWSVDLLSSGTYSVKLEQMNRLGPLAILTITADGHYDLSWN